MDANLDRKDVFSPLTMASTTPVVLMIILSIVSGVLIPLSIVLDNFGAENAKREQNMDPSKKEKTLTDVMFFNKYEERTKPQYAIAQPDEANADAAEELEEEAQEYDDEDDDDAYNIL